MTMKLTKFLALATIVFFAFACSKNADVDTALDKPSTRAVIANDSIQCIDGSLHFATAELCINTMNSLTSETDLHEFEKAYNFHSNRSFADTILEEFVVYETPVEYQALLETSTDYLKEEDGQLIPKITSVGYASIADMNGVFYVGGVKHTVVGDKVIIETTDSKTRANSIEEIEYIAPVEGSAQTRGETSKNYTNRRRETSKYKVFARTNVLRHVAAQTINGVKVYVSSFAVQVHVSGQKKKTLIGWNTYNDRFYVENLHWDINIGGKSIRFNEYNNQFGQSEYTKNFYVMTPFPSSWTAPSEVPMPVGFYCILHRARSRDMGKCGMLTDFAPCRPSPVLPLKECID